MKPGGGSSLITLPALAVLSTLLMVSTPPRTACAGERGRDCGRVFHFPLSRLYFVNCHKEDEGGCEVDRFENPFGEIADEAAWMQEAVCPPGPLRVPVKGRDGTIMEVELSKVTVVIEQAPDDWLQDDARAEKPAFSRALPFDSLFWKKIAEFLIATPDAHAGMDVVANRVESRPYRGGEIVAALNLPSAVSSRPLGLVVRPGAKSKPLCALTAEDVVGTFEFHDPQTDLELLDRNQRMVPQLHEMPSSAIERFMQSALDIPPQMPGRLPLKSFREIAALRCLGPIDRLNAVRTLSLPGGAMDFSSGVGRSARPSEFFLIDGKAYNNRDFGNYTWSIAMRIAGYDYSMIRTLSELNGAFGTYAQNDDNETKKGSAPVPIRSTVQKKDGTIEEKKNLVILLAGDSDPDQDAIRGGFHSTAAETMTQRIDREFEESGGCKTQKGPLVDALRSLRTNAGGR